MTLYVEEFYTDQTQTIVLLHGGGLSSKQWQPQVERLVDFHLLIPDLPEQGKTAGPFDLPDAGHQVADLIRQHGHDGKAHLVGLSLGGAVVLELLRTAPDSVQTAIVTGTSGKVSRMLGMVMLASAPLGRLFSAKWMTNAGIRQFGIEQYRDLVYDDLLRAVDPGFNQRIARALMALELPTQNRAPLLVLVGEKETSPAKQAARQILAAVPNTKGATVPKVGHVWNLQAPDLFCDVVRMWVLQQKVAETLRPIA
jgi:pimeloyl-ACP methyl ester carboxylesterase